MRHHRASSCGLAAASAMLQMEREQAFARGHQAVVADVRAARAAQEARRSQGWRSIAAFPALLAARFA